MKLILFVLLTICLINSVLSENKYFNFVGTYTNDCKDKTLGIGYTFTNNYCSGSINDNWLFNITGDGNEGEVTLFVEGGGCAGWFQPSGSTVYYNNKCGPQPGFSNESDSTQAQFSMIQFSESPIYEKNSVVFQYYSDNECTDITNAETFSNGLTITLADDSTVKYTCVSGKPFFEHCNGTKCVTKPTSIACEYQTSVFCSDN